MRLLAPPSHQAAIHLTIIQNPNLIAMPIISPLLLKHWNNPLEELKFESLL